MPRYVQLPSGLDRAIEICEQRPEVIAAIEEAVQACTARKLDPPAVDPDGHGSGESNRTGVPFDGKNVGPDRA